jgi:bifunctional non-homologous end joining protein LigD
LNPDRYTIRTVFPRLEQLGDLWKGVLERGIDMDECLSHLDDVLEG